MGAICDKTSLHDDCYVTTIILSPRLQVLTSIMTLTFLQLLQHASGSNLYLRVPTGTTLWMIGSTIDGDSGWIESASAGTVSPASPSNSVNKRTGQTSWQYGDANGWHDGDIRVVSIPRT